MKEKEMMSGEDRFWFGCWTIVGAVAVAICAGLTADSIYTDMKISEDIANGANPLAARCAHHGDSTNSSACVVLSTKEK